jgi:hypothetical protein
MGPSHLGYRLKRTDLNGVCDLQSPHNLRRLKTLIAAFIDSRRSTEAH